MKRAKKRIAVIGGGITGLTTAYRIKQKIEKEHLPFELILLEGSLKIGGKIYTVKNKTRYIDLGAESLDIRYPEALELIKELGLKDQLIFSEGNKPDVFFYNQLYQLNYPTYNGIPIRRNDIWKGNLLTMYGKIVTYTSYFNTFKKLEKDIETSTYLKRLLGDEMVEHIVEPFFNKIYASDLDKIGIKASRELVYEIEMKYGSLQKGLAAHPELLDGSGNYATFKNGLSVLTEALEEILKPHIQYRKKVFEIKKNDEDVYILDINHTEQVRVGSICLATPVTEYAKMIDHPEISRVFGNVETASVGYIVFGFSKKDIKNLPEGFGIVTPRRNDSFVTSVVFLDKKWPSLSEDEDVLIGVNFGRSGEDALVSLSNKEIEQSILKDLNTILGITKEPLFRIIKRWADAIPQFTVTQQEDILLAKQILSDDYPGIYIAGQGLAGFGINHCVQQANIIGNQIVEYAKKQNCL
ncbi:protoporphyrinogen oxidase [Carnobacterium sp. TMP28]|uniref:protoporphyrinogen oxidase n=1 Tax=Carnobacterium sp. TMP28 TaxID=3397060 RepID=UPI0039E02407